VARREDGRRLTVLPETETDRRLDVWPQRQTADRGDSATRRRASADGATGNTKPTTAGDSTNEDNGVESGGPRRRRSNAIARHDLAAVSIPGPQSGSASVTEVRRRPRLETGTKPQETTSNRFTQNSNLTPNCSESDNNTCASQAPSLLFPSFFLSYYALPASPGRSETVRLAADLYTLK